MILGEQILKLSGEVQNPGAYRRYLEGLDLPTLQDKAAALIADAGRPRNVVPARYWRALAKNYGGPRAH